MMNFQTPAFYGHIDVTRHGASTNTSTRRHASVHEPYLERAARNIASWKSYLPEDCVITMVRMGWDRTT
jgi:hypothetical protein